MKYLSGLCIRPNVGAQLAGRDTQERRMEDGHREVTIEGKRAAPL